MRLNGSSQPTLTGNHRAVTEARSTLDIRLRKRYAVRGASCFELQAELQVLPGFTVVLGHSGAGKTTLLRCIAGLCDPEQGSIAVGERILFDAARRVSIGPARRNVAFVFQDLALFPHLTVQQNIAYGLRLLDSKERERKTNIILESFQIAHLSKRLPRHTSGGEQQRVALARALVTEPSVLLLDEPLSSLDVRTKEGIVKDLRTWNEAHGIPILYVTHDHSEVFALGGRGVVLDRGRILTDNTPSNAIAGLPRDGQPQFAVFENVFDAVVIARSEEDGIMVCRLAGTAIELEAPLAPVALGAPVRLGIRATEILIASSRPDIVSAGRVLRGRVKRLDRMPAGYEVTVDCGREFRVQLGSQDPRGLQVSDEAWMVIGTRSCCLLGDARLNIVQRLFVFVCGGNTSRSPMAQAICNAEIAGRLNLPVEALRAAGIQAVSAGLSAQPGEPMTVEARQALSQLGVPFFEHKSGNLTADLVSSAAAIFCMTGKLRDRAIEMFPEAADKICCLQPDADFEDPSGHGPEAFVALGRQLRNLIQQRMDALLSNAALQ
jgi:molybdate transport system ATP-binding protein